MKRGEIWLADLEPVIGSEANKVRPVILVSNDHANRRAELLGRGVLTAVPLSSNVSRVFDFQVLLPASKTGLRRDSRAQAEQVRSIDVTRLSRLAGNVPPSLMRELDDALRLHLAL